MILISVTLVSCGVSMYQNRYGGKRPKYPRFKLAKVINKQNTGLEGVYKRNSGRAEWFRFFKDGRVFKGSNNDYNNLKTGFVGYYILNNVNIKIELLQARQGYGYTTIEGILKKDKKNVIHRMKRGLAKKLNDFNGIYSQIDTILKPLKADW